MNERIRKFERESHIDVYALGKDRDKWEKVLSKFAELIVRECAYIMDKDADHPFVSRGSILKYHFGVE
jgi:hypothetical protein